jgi:hypothetical protein
MRKFGRSIGKFLKGALFLGLLSALIWVVVCAFMPDSPLRQEILTIPMIVLVLEFWLVVLLVVLSPFMWLFSIIVGTIGLGVAVGNRASRQ